MPNELDILIAAQASVLGVVVRVSSFNPAVQRLYRVRRERATEYPEFSNLQFRRSPHQPETEIWIVKPPKALEHEPQPAESSPSESLGDSTILPI